jgi:predicted phage replisome organizer
MSKRFWFYKLGTDFFEKDEIKLLESQENGEKYILFLMKLMLRSMNDDEERPGRLMFQGKIPYTETLLSILTNTDIDVVRSSLAIFHKLGIVTGEEDGGAYLDWVGGSVDSETDGAARTRKWREKKMLMIGMSHGDGSVSQCDVSASQSDVTVTSRLYSNSNSDSSLSLSSGVREDNSEDIGEGPTPSKPLPEKIRYDFKESLWYGITDEQVQLWGEAYPAVDVDLELRQMGEWCKAAGAKGRKNNWRAFITNWLKRQQDKGGSVQPGQQKGGYRR